MATIRRYDWRSDSMADCYCEFREVSDGEYVEFDEYKKLLAKLEATTKALEGAVYDLDRIASDGCNSYAEEAYERANAVLKSISEVK